MAVEDQLNFSIVFYSPDGITSPVLDFLQELSEKNLQNAMDCIIDLQNLPTLNYSGSNVKTIRVGKVNCRYLRVKSASNIFRFYYCIKQPNIIVLYGFMKKSQKIDKRDMSKAEKNLQDFLNNNRTIPFDL